MDGVVEKELKLYGCLLAGALVPIRRRESSELVYMRALPCLVVPAILPFRKLWIVKPLWKCFVIIVDGISLVQL